MSSGGGTESGPEAIREASLQVDLYDPAVANAWQNGLFMPPIDKKLAKLSQEARKEAEHYIEWLTDGSPKKGAKKMEAHRDAVNAATAHMTAWVRAQTLAQLRAGKFVGLLGGDHSTPLGFLEALGEVHNTFGILQIDAHCDLRIAYEDFEHSHASIMYNAMQLRAVEHIVQVGIRDYSEGEVSIIATAPEQITTFFDRDLRRDAFEGRTWQQRVQAIVAALPAKVYISFDIDGLTPDHCPNTGTPVPGGLGYEQALYLLEQVANARHIIGFDLVEVSPGDGDGTAWDANVGARLLYRMANLSYASHRRHTTPQNLPLPATEATAQPNLAPADRAQPEVALTHTPQAASQTTPKAHDAPALDSPKATTKKAAAPKGDAPKATAAKPKATPKVSQARTFGPDEDAPFQEDPTAPKAK